MKPPLRTHDDFVDALSRGVAREPELAAMASAEASRRALRGPAYALVQLDVEGRPHPVESVFDLDYTAKQAFWAPNHYEPHAFEVWLETPLWLASSASSAGPYCSRCMQPFPMYGRHRSKAELHFMQPITGCYPKWITDESRNHSVSHSNLRLFGSDRWPVNIITFGGRPLSEFSVLPQVMRSTLFEFFARSRYGEELLTMALLAPLGSAVAPALRYWMKRLPWAGTAPVPTRELIHVLDESLRRTLFEPSRAIRRQQKGL